MSKRGGGGRRYGRKFVLKRRDIEKLWKIFQLSFEKNKGFIFFIFSYRVSQNFNSLNFYFMYKNPTKHLISPQLDHLHWEKNHKYTRDVQNWKKKSKQTRCPKINFFFLTQINQLTKTMLSYYQWRPWRCPPPTSKNREVQKYRLQPRPPSNFPIWNYLSPKYQSNLLNTTLSLLYPPPFKRKPSDATDYYTPSSRTDFHSSSKP